MKTLKLTLAVVDYMYNFTILVVVGALSFLATFWGDIIGHMSANFGFAIWVGLTYCRPRILESSTVCHLKAASWAFFIILIHIGVLFFVNELTRRGIGFALSGESPWVEVPWAVLSFAFFWVVFFWGRVHLRNSA